MEDARQKQAVIRKPRGIGAQKNAISQGKARLNSAVDKTIELFSQEIALSLALKTIGGNSTSAKLLFALAEGRFDCEDESMMKSLLVLAEKLAAEPQYSDDNNGAILEGNFE